MNDDALADMHLAVAELLDRMVIANLARSCRANASEADVAVAIRRHEVLRDEGAAPVAVGTLQ